MQTIQTRYRDIPWNEVDVSHKEAMPDDPINWNQLRVRPIDIRIPALPDIDGCGGPWFRIVSGPVKQCFYVCPHLAEIGD